MTHYKQQVKSDRLKLILSVLWFLFTFAMVAWWWVFSLQQLDLMASEVPREKYESLRRMLLWEGPILLAFILGGGSALLTLTNRERRRSLQLRMFFSNFSHDLKTSISRLRLRTELLAENSRSPELQQLIQEASRLDLQLENSLWVAKGEEQSLSSQQISLSEVIGQLRGEWPDLEIELQKNATIQVDPVAIRSVLRNIFQNSWLHGEAQKVKITPESLAENKVVLHIQDNGKGYKGSLTQLGKELRSSMDHESNGIGLYLTRFLVEKMSGHIQFAESENGFLVNLTLRGKSN
jgi:signal transduction histidine kinase